MSNPSLSHARNFSHSRLEPLQGNSIHKAENTTGSRFFIKQGILSPLVQKSNDTIIGKKILPSLSQADIFKLQYSFAEVRKVPFRKTYNREKLVLINTNPSILTQKESLTIPKNTLEKCATVYYFLIFSKKYSYQCLNIIFQEKKLVNPDGVSTFMQRVKNIYGKGQIYKLRRDLNEEVDDKLKDVISRLRSDKTLAKNYSLNRKKLTHSEIENLFQLNHEINTVRSLEGWFNSCYNKQAALGKICY